MPGTWSTGRQFISSAPTPIVSNRRAARPKRSPSGGPQCCPYTPQTPWRQRRKLSQTGSPVSSSALDRLERERIADEGQRLEQYQIRRLLRERPREQIERALRAPVELTSSEIANATAHSSSRSPSSHRLAGEPDAEPRDVHPVHELRLSRARAHLRLGGATDRPRVRRDDVAANVDIAAVHVEHRLGRPVQRPGAPELRCQARARRAAEVAAAPSRRRRRGPRSARRRAAPDPRMLVSAGRRGGGARDLARRRAHTAPLGTSAASSGASKCVIRLNSANRAAISSSRQPLQPLAAEGLDREGGDAPSRRPLRSAAPRR